MDKDTQLNLILNDINKQYQKMSNANDYEDCDDSETAILNSIGQSDFVADYVIDQVINDKIFRRAVTDKVVEKVADKDVDKDKVTDQPNVADKDKVKVTDQPNVVEKDVVKDKVADINKVADVVKDIIETPLIGLTTSQQEEPVDIGKIKIHKDIQKQLPLEKKTMFEAFVLPDVDNIKSYMHTRTPLEESLQEVETYETMLGLINMIEGVTDEIPYSSQTVGYVFVYLSQNHKLLEKKPSYALLLKALFHQYIVEKGFTNLIELYNRVFNDNLYSDIKNPHVFYPILPQEWIYDRLNDYREKCKQIEYRKRAKRIPPAYELDEIIGAKDKEGKWWMSRVLAIYEFQGHAAYYVEFLGWGPKFNEFIVDGFRLDKFKPKKHRYFRPAWRKLKEEGAVKK